MKQTYASDCRGRAKGTLPPLFRRFAVCALLAFFAVAGAQPREAFVASLPAVFYRPVDFRSNHNCVATAPVAFEVFMVSPHINDWRTGQRADVNVIEFFSGKHYKAVLQMQAEGAANLVAQGHSLMLDCRLNVVTGPGDPVAADGSWLEVMNVGTDGRYGSDVTFDRDDIGNQGLVRVRPDGQPMWAVLLAVRDRRVRGHPIYDHMPDWYRISDWSPVSERLLPDGSLLLVYPRHLAFRLDLSTGQPAAPHPDVRAVPLQAWAQMKHDTYVAYGNCPVAAPSQSSPNGRCDSGEQVRRYYFALRRYLFND